jgi:sugar lactone lactonase YvrE
MMVRMQQQGLAYDFSTNDNTKNIQGTEVFDYVNDVMKMAGDPMGDAEVAFSLPEDVKLPEAISWDETRQKFLVGTVADGSVLAIDKDGKVEELFKATESNGLWSVFDILVDAPRNRLWITSAASPKFDHFAESDQGRSALFEYNLETLKPIAIYPVPVDGKAHSLGNMVMNPIGDIFIVDRVLPIVYKKPAADAKLVPLLASREMVSMRGIAMQPDGSLMYIADREMGILVVDLKGGRAGKLAIPETLNIGGIDGLYLWNNQLIMIQNGVQPQRVMRLQLDSSGTKVESVRPLAVALPDFDFPSYGVIKDKSLYYFDHSQWIDKAGQLKAVKVLRTPVDSIGELAQPDMADYLKQRGEKQQQQIEQQENQ